MSGRREQIEAAHPPLARPGRKGLVGQGYMPKGGARAAAEHNARVRAQAPASVVESAAPDAGTDARASASSGSVAGQRLMAVAAACGPLSLVLHAGTALL